MSEPEDEIILSGSEETLKPVITLLVGIFQLLNNIQSPPIYGIPIHDFEAERKFKPQVMLYFEESYLDVKPGFTPIAGEITFRLMKYESETITQSYINELALIIASKFAKPKFIWHRGKCLLAYTDQPKGYQLKIYCKDEVEGQRVLEQVLDLQGDVVKQENVKISKNPTPGSTYPEIAPRARILGKTYRLPRRRPITNVVFKYALLRIWGMQDSICLVDTTGRFPKAIQKVLKNT